MDKDDEWIRKTQDSKVRAPGTTVLGNGVTAPVIAGLAIGVALIVLFATAFTFKSATAKSDSELIVESENLAAVKYLISKYPDAQVMVNRSPSQNVVQVQYHVEGQRQLCEPDPNAFGDDCIRTLYLGITMKQLGDPAVSVGCLSGGRGIIHIGDPIKYIEDDKCFQPPHSVDFPRHPTE